MKKRNPIDRTIEIPEAVQSRQLLIRGTQAWDDREWRRERAGHYCISLGPIPAEYVFIPPPCEGVPDDNFQA